MAGDFARLTNRLRVDKFGLPSPVNIQLFQAQESSLGSEFQFTAQEFIPALTDGDEVEDPSVRTIPITSDFLNVNLRTLHDSQFGAPDGTETITFIVRSGVTVGSDAAGGGTNVQFEQRSTLNDFYDAGNSARLGVAIGEVPILQRSGCRLYAPPWLAKRTPTQTPQTRWTTSWSSIPQSVQCELAVGQPAQHYGWLLRLAGA